MPAITPLRGCYGRPSRHTITTPGVAEQSFLACLVADSVFECKEPLQDMEKATAHPSQGLTSAGLLTLLKIIRICIPSRPTEEIQTAVSVARHS